jgi:4-amino-4-deoxy-L-arabinose transferase-like glycosyltransferase
MRRGQRRRAASAATKATRKPGWFASPAAARVVVALLFAMFGIVFARSLDSYGMLMWDEAEYATLGRSVVRGEGFSIGGQPNALRPPVLPLAGAASLWLSGESTDHVVKRPLVLFALLAMGVVYAAASLHFGRATAAVTAACLGMAPVFWASVPQFLSEVPFMAFFAAAVVALYVGLYRDARFFLVSAVTWSLALLTRYTALLFLPIAAGFVVVALALREPGPRERLRSRALLASPLAALVVLAPWFVRQQLAFGDALAGIRQSSTQLQVYMPGVSMPALFYVTSLPDMLTWPILAGFVAGGAWAFKHRDRFLLHCLAVIAGLLLWFSVYRYKEVRLVTSIVPFLAIVAGAGLTRWLTASPARRFAPGLLTAALGILFAVVYTRMTANLAQSFTLGYPSFLDAMKSLRQRSLQDATVMGANVPQIAWYGDRKVIDFPAQEADLRERLARVEWVVMTNFERGQRPYVRRLMSTPSAKRLHGEDAVVYHDKSYVTVLLRAGAWSSVLAPAAAAPSP